MQGTYFFNHNNIAQDMEYFCNTLRGYGQQIVIQNSENRNDEAKRAECLYQGVLNHLHGLQLINLNTTREAGGGSFAAGIDLLDPYSGVAYQITSQKAPNNRRQKVSDAVSKTADRKRRGKPLYDSVTRLVVLFVTAPEAVESPGNADIHEANAAGFTLEVASLWDIISRAQSLIDGSGAGPGSVSDAIDFVRRYFRPDMAGPGVMDEAAHREFNVATSFQGSVNSLRVDKAYYRRAQLHKTQTFPRPSFAGPFAEVADNLPPRVIPEQINAEALMAEGSLVRLWGIDQAYLDSLEQFLATWNSPPHNQPPRLSALAELGLLEKEILNTALWISSAVRTLSLKRPPGHSIFADTLVSFGKGSAFQDEAWRTIHHEDLMQQRILFTAPRDWIPRNDNKAWEIATQQGVADLLGDLMNGALVLDALVEQLDTRVRDHEAMIDAIASRHRPHPQSSFADNPFLR